MHPRKLKINKKFKPIPTELEDELFPNGFFVFNITKLINFIKTHLDQLQPERLSVNDLRRLTFSTLDETTVQQANISEPIILAEIAPDQYNVIDGHHRLERAYRRGEDKILVYKICPKTHTEFLTSKEAYEDYVRYWNAKLNNYSPS